MLDTEDFEQLRIFALACALFPQYKHNSLPRSCPIPPTGTRQRQTAWLRENQTKTGGFYRARIRGNMTHVLRCVSSSIGFWIEAVSLITCSRLSKIESSENSVVHNLARDKKPSYTMHVVNGDLFKDQLSRFNCNYSAFVQQSYKTLQINVIHTLPSNTFQRETLRAILSKLQQPQRTSTDEIRKSVAKTCNYDQDISLVSEIR